MLLLLSSCSKGNENLTEKFTITINETIGGKIEITPIKDSYEKGEIIELTAINNNDFIFKNWIGLKNVNNEKKVKININQNYIIDCKFVRASDFYLLNKSDNESVKVWWFIKGSNRDNYIKSKIITLKPKEKCLFLSGEGTAQEVLSSITMNDIKDIQIDFNLPFKPTIPYEYFSILSNWKKSKEGYLYLEL